MNDREKLIEILRVPIYPHELADPTEVVADYLLDNGITFATDNNVGDKWIPVTERLPEVWKDVLVHREGGIVDIEYQCSGGGWIYDTETIYNATHWMPLPEPPKEVV